MTTTIRVQTNTRPVLVTVDGDTTFDNGNQRGHSFSHVETFVGKGTSGNFNITEHQTLHISELPADATGLPEYDCGCETTMSHEGAPTDEGCEPLVMGDDLTVTALLADLLRDSVIQQDTSAQADPRVMVTLGNAERAELLFALLRTARGTPPMVGNGAVAAHRAEAEDDGDVTVHPDFSRTEPVVGVTEPMTPEPDTNTAGD